MPCGFKYQTHTTRIRFNLDAERKCYPLNKRFISMLLALLFVLTGFAFAEQAAPSVTVDSLITVTGAVSTSGAILPESFKLAVAPKSETALKLTSEIDEAAKAAPVINYFGAETAISVAAKLPEGVSADTLKLAELTTITVSEYDESYADVVVTIAAAAEYADDTTVVVLVGVVTDDAIVWIPLDAVVVDGQISVVFTQDVLTAAADSELVFALLTAE